MTIDKALEKFAELINDTLATFNDFRNIINQLSVVDDVAPEGAMTHLYTKINNEKGFLKDFVRALDNTDAFEFLEVLDDKINDFLFDFNEEIATKAKIWFSNRNRYLRSKEGCCGGYHRL